MQLLHKFAFSIAKDFYELVQMLDDGVLVEKGISSPNSSADMCIQNSQDLLEHFPSV